MGMVAVRRTWVRLFAVFSCGLLLAALTLAAAEPKKSKAEAAGPAAPVFSIPGGIFTNALTLKLTAADAVVRFTVDGSEPGTASTVCTGPIRITSCTLLRAKAWHRDGTVSRCVSQNYFFVAPELLTVEFGLPLVLIHSEGEEISAMEKSLAGLRVLEDSAGQTTFTSGTDFEGLAQMNIRGHSSLRYPKHSYSVKIVDEALEAHKVSLLKLPKESAWVLYGPYPDKTLMRDALAYELSNDMGRWAPHTRFVEAFVHHGGGRMTPEDYVGVYLLVEKITRDKNRVNVARLETSQNREPEISGGYIFKKDHTGSTNRKKFGEEGPPMVGRSLNQPGFPTAPGGFPADPAGFLPPYQGTTATTTRTTTTTTRTTRKPKAATSARPITNYVAAAVPQGIRLDDDALFPDDEGFHTTLQRNQFYFYEPEPDEITAVQRAWLKDYVNRLEIALYGPDFTNPETGYRAFIDVDSFIDHHLLVELTKNVDGFRFSTFYYKDRGGKLQMGPAWDWNLAFGNCDGKQGYIPQRWLWPQLDDQQYSWFRRLFEDPDFGQRYVDRWAQLRTNIFSTSNVLAKVDRMAVQLQSAQQRNFSRWEILGRDISPNYFVGASYAEEVNWMKKWIEDRLAWIERQFVPAPEITSNKPMFLASPVSGAKIYFTMDGSDPRASGGGVAVAAKPFGQSVTLAPGATLMARAQVGARWSPPLTVRAVVK